MYDIYLRDLISLCEGNLLIGNEKTKLDNFSKDTREIKKGDIYIGIKGDNFNGNNYYLEALKKGAKGVILDNNTNIDMEEINKFKDIFVVIVPNTITAIGTLAAYKRSLFNGKVVAVTGSSGKTSTKDMIVSVLKSKYKVLNTQKNFNNNIGVPLTILNLKNEEVMVIEMGMNNLREIAYLSNIAKPDIAVITNIGTAHIGKLGSRENILKAKLEVLEAMDEDGILIINNDNDMLHIFNEKNKVINTITYGIDNDSDYNANNLILNEESSIFTVEDKEFNVPIPGIHFVLNFLAAYSVGRKLDLSTKDIAKGIKNIKISENRMEFEKINNVTLIKDYYNANYDSMVASLGYLKTLKQKRVAILGDMFELGKFSKQIHLDVGKMTIGLDELILIGKDAKYIKKGAIKSGFNKDKIFYYKRIEDSYNKINDLLDEECAILIKASHGMNFSIIYDYIKRKM